MRKSFRKSRPSRLSRAVAAVRRRKAIVLVCAVLGPAVAVVTTVLAEKRFESEASILVVAKGGPEDAASQVANALRLIDADPLPRRTEKALEGIVDRKEVASSVDASARPGSNVITITATMEDPRFARATANAFAQRFVTLARESAALGDTGVKVVEEARASSEPVSPRPVRNTLTGLATGLALGVGLALLLAGLDRRVARSAELEEALGVPLLGRIPESPALALGDGLRELPAPEAEAFQLIRTSLRYLEGDRELKSVLLTSVAPRDGKSTVAFGIAAAAAAVGGRALVIEADMRQPSLAAVADRFADTGGLSTVLAGNAGLAEAVTEVPVAPGLDRGSASIDLLMAGPVPPNPTRLIESGRMRELLHEAESAYDLILIDTPPATMVADAVPLIPQVDAVVVVAGLRRDDRGALRELGERLGQLDAPLVGVIANFAERPDESYYGYIRAHEAALAEAASAEAAPAEAAPVEAAPEAPPAPRVERRPPEPAPLPERRPREPAPVPEPAAEERAATAAPPEKVEEPVTEEAREPAPTVKEEPAPAVKEEPPPPAPVVAPPEVQRATVDGPVDLNEATFEQLRALDLSPTQAKRILSYRQRKGGFSSVDEIDELPGFPDRVRERLKQQVKVGSGPRRRLRRRQRS